MSPRQRLSPEARREQLLAAAKELAAGGDVALLSVQDIARHAGVSEGLLYHYFPTKDALLEAVVRRAADAMLSSLDRVTRGAPVLALTASLEAFLDHIEEDPTGWRAVLQARTGNLAEIADTVEAEARRLTLSVLGIDEASPLLRAALDGWAAFERECCLAWLSNGDTIARATLEDVLVRTFFAALEAAAEHDDQAAGVLARLQAEGGQDEGGQSGTP